MPWNYKWLANGNGKLYKRYILGFIKKNEPHLKPKKIVTRDEHLPDIVICELEKGIFKRKAAYKKKVKK